jgi:hypothetical protein
MAWKLHRSLGMTFAYARTVPINKNYCGMTFAYARTVPTSCAKAVPRIHGTIQILPRQAHLSQYVKITIKI